MSHCRVSVGIYGGCESLLERRGDRDENVKRLKTPERTWKLPPLGRRTRSTSGSRHLQHVEPQAAGGCRGPLPHACSPLGAVKLYII